MDALDAADCRLNALGKRLLLTIDEFEVIDKLIGENRFDERLLETVRHSIQVHRRIIWLFAGSHGLDELPNAPWASYFISVRTPCPHPSPPPSDARCIGVHWSRWKVGYGGCVFR